MLAIFFVFGLIIGSFLNVVVYRTNLAETLLGRSHCPKCKKKIRWYDNIPVLSFVFLGAKCRDCREKISWIYPLVELLTGAVFAFLGTKFFVLFDSTTWFSTSYYLIIVSILIVIFVYDWLYMEIPDLVLWLGVGIAIFGNLVIDLQKGALGAGILSSLSYSGTLAAFCAFTFFFALSKVSKEKWMGMGDVFLVILLGLILGWPKILLALFLAFAIGAICGIILIARGKKKMSSQIPFAPFLVSGTIIAMLYYEPIISWYLRFF
jgi:prepilin signal peptidase PulO-like enzyme (type II secretory pathway)